MPATSFNVPKYPWFRGPVFAGHYWAHTPDPDGHGSYAEECRDCHVTRVYARHQPANGGKSTRRFYLVFPNGARLRWNGLTRGLPGCDDSGASHPPADAS